MDKETKTCLYTYQGNACLMLKTYSATNNVIRCLSSLCHNESNAYLLVMEEGIPSNISKQSDILQRYWWTFIIYVFRYEYNSKIHFDTW